MIKNTTRPWFEVWGTEQAQNHFLKGLLVFFVSLCFTQTCALVYLATRKPILIGVSPTETRILSVAPPKPELLESEVMRAVRGYIEAHYNWESTKVDEAFQAAAKYVGADYQKAFLTANAEQIKLAKDKKLSQRFYINTERPDMIAKAVQVSGDRILTVDGLRAVSALTVAVQFDYGPRTEANPEGIYIVGEKFVASSERMEGGQQ